MSDDALDAAELKGARRRAFPQSISPMLASPAESPFIGEKWIFEPKLDGIRCLALIHDGKAKLLSRRALDLTPQYPLLAAELAQAFGGVDLVLDGEIIALNEQGRPSFQHLQQRMNLTREADIAKAEKNVPAYFFVFDILQFGEFDLTAVSLSERKGVLEAAFAHWAPNSNTIKQIVFFRGDGAKAYEACLDNGFEGVVAKRTDSRYECGKRSPSWLKVKAQQTGEFIIGGFTAGQGSRADTFGALLLGYFEAGRYQYAGSVGTGFDQKILRDLTKRMEPLHSKQCPFVRPPDDKKDITWLRPNLVAEIKFMDWTRDGHLRSPVYLWLRSDKGPQDVERQTVVRPFDGDNPFANVGHLEIVATKNKLLPVVGARTDNELLSNVRHVLAALDEGGKKLEVHLAGCRIELTSLDKVLWPASAEQRAITKGDYLRYLAILAPIVLSHLQYRPLTLIRSPGGVKGKPFFQKHWHVALPEFFETLTVHDDDSKSGEKQILMCNNFASLLYLGQNGVIEFHTNSARIDDIPRTDTDVELTYEARLEFPDYMIFDLDWHSDNLTVAASRSDYQRVCAVACHLREALEQLGMNVFVKSSGKSGLHLFVPIERNLDYDHTNVLIQTISKAMAANYASLVTIEFNKQKRGDRIYLDTSSNGNGKTIVSSYSARLVEDAAISLPLTWKEVESNIWIKSSVLSAPARIQSLGDLWLNILNEKTDLHVQLARRDKK